MGPDDVLRLRESTVEHAVEREVGPVSSGSTRSSRTAVARSRENHSSGWMAGSRTNAAAAKRTRIPVEVVEQRHRRAEAHGAEREGVLVGRGEVVGASASRAVSRERSS